MQSLNKKAVGYIGGLILFVIFFLFWLAGLGDWLATAGASMASGETGIIAFFLYHINVFIFIFYIAGLTYYLSFGGGK